MSEVIVKFSAEDAKLWAAIQRQIGAQKKLGDEVDKTNQKTKAATAEEERFAAAIKKIVATPLEKYNAQLNKLRDAQAKGRITKEEYNRALEREKLLLQQTEAAGARKLRTDQGAISVGGSLITRLGGLATGYISAQQALNLYNQAIENNVELQTKAYDKAAQLGAKQQEALKNLTGLSEGEKRELLTGQVTGIQARTGFESKEKLTEAIGAVFGAVGDKAIAVSAVEAAAKLTVATPESITSVASGAGDIARATGIIDAEKNLSLLLSAGSVSRIEDPERLARAYAPAISAGVAGAPKQHPEEAARETAAILGVLGQWAADQRGESTGTAGITLLAKMTKFFDERPELQANTQKERIARIQSDKALRKELLGDEGFGEERFKKTIEQMLTAGTPQAADLAAAIPKMTFDAKVFQEQISQSHGMTPQLRLAIERARTRAERELAARDIQGVAGFARDETLATLKETRSPGIDQMKDWLDEQFASQIGLGAASEKEVPSQAIEALLERQQQLIRRALPTDIYAEMLAQSEATGTETTESIAAKMKRDRISPEEMENARAAIRAQSRMSTAEISSLPGDERLKKSLQQINELISSIDNLVGSLESPGPMRGAAAEAIPTQKPWQPPAVDIEQLRERNKALLREGYDLASPSHEAAIELAERAQNDPAFAQGMSKNLKQSGVSKEDFGRAKDFLKVSGKDVLSDEEINALPIGLKQIESLKKVQSLIREHSAPEGFDAADFEEDYRRRQASSVITIDQAELLRTTQQMLNALQGLPGAIAAAMSGGRVQPDMTNRIRREAAPAAG